LGGFCELLLLPGGLNNTATGLFVNSGVMVRRYHTRNLYEAGSGKNMKVLAGIVIAVLLVVFFGKAGIVAYISPPAEFHLKAAPAPPNYRDNNHWASLPSKFDAADLTGADGDTSEIQTPDVDVFYIYPTTYFGPGGWNAEMTTNQHAALTVDNMLATQASAFNACCRIYAPHYRQAHIGAFISRETDAGFKALDLAYSDVEKAFDYFLEHHNKGRPFIIASHSQGSLHAQRLLVQRIDQSALQKRLVAAYLLGYWMPTDMFERSLKNTPVCTDAEKTGCVVTYDSYDVAGPGPGRLPDTGVPHWYQEGWEWSDNKPTVCVNPLSWRADMEFVAREKNLGALSTQIDSSFLNFFLNRNPGYENTELSKVDLAHTSASCHESGSLLIDSQLDNAYSNPGSGEDRSFHKYDWNFFYMNIRENAAQRISAFNKMNVGAQALAAHTIETKGNINEYSSDE